MGEDNTANSVAPTPEQLDPSTELVILRAQLAAEKAANTERESKLRNELEEAKIDHMVDVIAIREKAINPQSLKLLLQAEGKITRQDHELFINDREVTAYIRQQKQGPWWNVFRDTYEMYRSTNGKPADPPDRRRLTGAEYAEIRKTNPEAIGLRKRK